MSDLVCVRVRSHRANDRLKRLLGVEKLDEYFNFYEGGGFVKIPAEHLAAARGIPGITKARPAHELMRCWATDRGGR